MWKSANAKQENGVQYVLSSTEHEFMKRQMTANVKKGGNNIFDE
jgi:hypothetical protein